MGAFKDAGGSQEDPSFPPQTPRKRSFLMFSLLNFKHSLFHRF